MGEKMFLFRDSKQTGGDEMSRFYFCLSLYELISFWFYCPQTIFSDREEPFEIIFDREEPSEIILLISPSPPAGL